MKEQAISKINNIGKVGYILTIIAKIFVIVGLVFCIVGAVIFAKMPNDFLKIGVNGDALIDVDLSCFGITLSEQDQKDMEKNFSEGNIKVDVTGSYAKNLEVNTASVNDHGFSLRASGDMFDFSLHNVAWVMVSGCITLIMTIVTLSFIESLCKAFRNCASPFDADVIVKMKRLAYSLIPWAVLSNITNGLAAGIMTNSFEFNLGISLSMVLVILLILGLAYIFQYGAMLQQESDETLQEVALWEKLFFALTESWQTEK